jgi:hypothetical protein
VLTGANVDAHVIDGLGLIPPWTVTAFVLCAQ